MNIRLRLLVTFMLYIFMSAVYAHPGPHSHAGLSEDTWHAFFGWEFCLTIGAIGILRYAIRRHLRKTRTQ